MVPIEEVLLFLFKRYIVLSQRDVDPVGPNDTAFLHLESWEESMPLSGDQVIYSQQ